MNFLQIALTTKCNLACGHCPMAEYRNTDDTKWHLTNEVLLPFIEKHIDPRQWLIELTGGEPALYDGINELCDWLAERGYQVLIKTNGTLPLPKRSGIVRCAAFHQLNNPPRYFDVFLIVDKLERGPKEKYCKDHEIPYEVIGFNKEHVDDAVHGFDKMAFIEPNCHQTACPAAKVKIDIKNNIDISRLEYAEFKPRPACKWCKAAIDAWRFKKYIFKV